MIPISLTIKGIGPHEDTTVAWSELASPVAICASYGTGKTWLIECIIAALYGEFAWYQGSIYNALTQGGTGEGSIELIFEHGGRRYQALRVIKDTGKTQKQDASLVDLDTAQMVAGPKIGDFQRAIVAMMGDLDTALSTWFLSQNRRGDLCGQPGEKELVARRREVFNELIGTGKLDQVEERAGDHARKLGGSLDELEAQLAGEPDYESAIAEACENLRGGQSMLEAGRRGLEEEERDLEAARCALRDAQGGDDTLRAQIAAHEGAQRELGSIRQREATLDGESKLLEMRAAGLEQARQDEQAHYWLKERRGELELQAKAFQARQAWERTLNELKLAAATIKRRILDLESVPGADEATRAKAATADELRNLGIAAKRENEAIAQRNAGRAQRRQNANIHISKARASIEQIEQGLASKPITPFGDECSPCPLMQEYAGLPRQLEDQRGILSDAEAILAAIEPDETLADLAELRAQYTQAEAAREAVAAAEETHRKLVAARGELVLAERQLEEHSRPCAPFADGVPMPVEDPSQELANVRAEVDRLAGAEERVRSCEQAASDLEQKRVELKKTRQQRNEAAQNVNTLAGAAESARKALADRDAQRAELRAEVQRLEAAVASGRQTIEGLTAGVARHEARIEDLEQRRGEAQQKRERAAGMRDDLEGFKDLRACFGPRGVRQILIDAAAPELEVIADQLFEVATGGRMRLRIATQTAGRGGVILEDFSILVRDERGERDATRFSGGQLQLIQIIFRLAVAIWVGKIRGHKPDCLFLDEAFDRLGAEGTEDLMRVLDHLAGSVRTIVVVTHDPLIAERMRSQVRLRRGILGVQVQTLGVQAAEVA